MKSADSKRKKNAVWNAPVAARDNGTALREEKTRANHSGKTYIAGILVSPAGRKFLLAVLFVVVSLVCSAVIVATSSYLWQDLVATSGCPDTALCEVLETIKNIFAAPRG